MAPASTPPSSAAHGWRSAFEERRRGARQGAYRPLVPVALSFAGGIAGDRCISVGPWWLLLSVGFLAAWAIAWRTRAKPSLVWLLLAVLSTGGAWHHARWRLFDSDDVGRFATAESAPVCLEAVVVDNARRVASPAPSPLRAIPQGEKTELALRVTRVRNREAWRPASGRVDLIVDGHALGMSVGDRVRVFAQLRAGGEPLNPGQFDFASDMRADRRLATLRSSSPDCVVLLGSSRAPSVWRLLADARVGIENLLHRELGPRRAPVAAAMLVGARHGLEKQRSELFRRTGNLHVLVVSGLHVGLVVGVFYAAARLGWFPRRPTLLVVMLLILGYTLLTGARPPAVRAAVLAEVMCLAAIFGRQVLALNSLAAATIIVLALNPGELFRAGPQLSFIAAGTLIWFAKRQLERQPQKPIERLLASVRPLPLKAARWAAGGAGMTLLATLLVWLATAPLLATRFHLLSPIAIPASVGVFLLVAAAVTTGLGMIVCEVLMPPLVAPLGWACGTAVDGLLGIVQAASDMPGGYHWLAGPAAWWTLGAYGLMAAGLLFGDRSLVRSRIIKLGAAWVVVGVASSLLPSEPKGLRCSFIAVGHGCSVLVETPGGPTLLYDAGSLGSPEASAETISGALWAKGVSRIDVLVVSHADVDHFNAVPALLERIPVGRVVTTESVLGAAADEYPRSAPAELKRAILRYGIPVDFVGQGDRIRLGAATADVLHPLDSSIGGSDNALSLVLAIEYAGRRVLLPGDLESPGLEDLMFQASWDTDVLLAPHHGSARSDPPGFAAWSRPEWVVVSGGGNQAYSASAGRTYQRAGAVVLRSSEVGLTEFTLEQVGVSVRSFKQGDNPPHPEP